LSNVMFSTQMALGWCFPNAIMQYAVPDLESLSIDLAALTRRRDLLAATLNKAAMKCFCRTGLFIFGPSGARDRVPQQRIIRTVRAPRGHVPPGP
jgi:aspartate aminotransferase